MDVTAACINTRFRFIEQSRRLVYNLSVQIFLYHVELYL